MKKYWVSCSTITYGHASVEVEAKNKKEAIEIAEEKIMCEDHSVEINHSQLEIQDDVEVTE